MTTQSLLVELLVEELPPKVLQKLGDAFASQLLAQLQAQGLAGPSSVVTAFATPRRLAAHVTQVLEQAPDQRVLQKLMPAAVGLDALGQPSLALLKKLQALGADVAAPSALVARLTKKVDGKAEVLFWDSVLPGVNLVQGLQKALDEALAKLPIPKVMRYQLAQNCALPGWSSVSFVRPAHGLVALYGAAVVPVQALGLEATRSTRGHRFEAEVSPVTIANADAYAATLEEKGAVIASFAKRRATIAIQLAAAAQALRPIDDAALLDEVTALVERPNVLVCAFDKQFLDVPPECLILTMKANQKYFPLLDANGKLTHQFLVVSNITPADPSAVREGNERVVRSRLADAKFFFDQDRKTTLASRLGGLDKVVYHHQLGSQAARTERVRQIAQGIAALLVPDAPASTTLWMQSVDTAAQLAKADLLTHMVGEFPELQGIMGGYYARNDGLPEAVAHAIEDHYKPRFAGDDLPRNNVGLVVALADKLETLVGMFGIGNLPTGDKDPFALRRHALGVIRMLVEKDLALDLPQLLRLSALAFGDKISDATQALTDFIYDRSRSYFDGTVDRSVRTPHGVVEILSASAQELDAVLALKPQRLSDVGKRLAAVRDFAAMPEALALAAANKRISNILKKAGGVVEARVNDALLQEAAEIALAAALKAVAPAADAAWAAGHYSAHLQALAALKAPVDAFFDAVMVHAADPALKANRLGLLATLHAAMNRVADLSKLAA